jgi:NDP-sugar pyrophosphorylase family protein
MVRRAVLLAADRGTRLGAITADYPKALLEVAGKPIIRHAIEGLSKAGVRELTVVTGHHAALLESDIGSGDNLTPAIRYVRQHELDGTARALARVRDWLGADQFLFGWADILVEPANYINVTEAARGADGALAVNYVDDPFAGAAVYVNRAKRIERIVERLPRGTSTTHWNNAGFGILPPSIWSVIDSVLPSLRGEYELPQAIAALVKSGAHLRAVPVSGPWFDIGTPPDLEAAKAAWARRTW